MMLAAVVLLQVQIREFPKDWKKIVTDHFDLYYPDEAMLGRAREFGGWFEEAWADLVRETGVEPPRVSVFLYRSVHDLEQSSFLAAPPPTTLAARARVHARDDRHDRARCRPDLEGRAFALAEPERNRILIHCQASDRWNRWFVRHELVHQIQFQRIFGPRLPSWSVDFKSGLVPAWYWEGAADQLAGVFDSSTDQYLRDLAAERLYELKDLFSADLLNGYDRQAVYVEGSYFLRFLESRYGAGTSRKLLEAMGDGLPIPTDRVLRAVTGEDGGALLREFALALRTEREALYRARPAPPQDRRLTDSRAYYRRKSWGGRWSPDGRHLAWVGDRDVHPNVYVDGEGLLGFARGLEYGALVSAPAWSPDGRRVAVVEDYATRDHLLLVGLDGTIERLRIDLDEIADPSWSPDGTRIAFSAMADGRSRLYTYHLATGTLEPVPQEAGSDRSPAYGPDGRLAWIREIQGRTELHVSGRGRIAPTWATLDHPQWSFDGKSIVVAADVGGVYDAFVVDVQTESVKRWTRWQGGVSYPAFAPDGSLVVTVFEARGLDLYKVTGPGERAEDFEEPARQAWVAQFSRSVAAGELAVKTRIWGFNSLSFPVTGSSPVLPGLESSFGDLDAENLIFLSARGVSNRYWAAGATVENTRWWPTLSLSAQGVREGELEEGRATPAVELTFWNELAVRGGWIGRYRTEAEQAGNGPRFFDSGPTVGFRYSSQEGYVPYDPAQGIALGASASFFREGFGGGRNLDEYSGFLEASTEFAQDLILWGRVGVERLRSKELLEDEPLKIREVVRGAREFEGTDRGVVTVEFRFPIWRDLLVSPLEPAGLAEWWVLKDVRGFLFAQSGYAGSGIRSAIREGSAVSVGAGLRLDLSFLAWPVINSRVPARVEFWAASVTEEGEPLRGAVGVAFQLGDPP